jgi:uncharacterized membrane protein YcfT
MIDEFAARYVYFFAGYCLAARIFDLAAWGKENRAASLGLLVAWAAINGVATFTSAPAAWAQQAEFWSDMPVVSLMLGAAGAYAVVLLTAVLSTVSGSGWLAYLGRNSIVVYLAFFLPMAVSRAVLLKFAPFLDIGTVSLLVTIAGVAGPVVLYWMIQWTGYGRFLFERPGWAHVDQPAAPRAKAALSPAE